MICKSFNRFYASQPVVAAETEELKYARLDLVKAFSIVLKEGLKLLGITVVERM